MPATATGLLPLTATTLHRLLGSRPDTSSRFRHNRDNRLPHDVIIVDETSMVSLSMMARLLEAVRPESRLVLVGDPDQLASVEAGAVLADLVEGLAATDDSPIASLVTAHRFGASIGSLAEGDPRRQRRRCAADPGRRRRPHRVGGHREARRYAAQSPGARMPCGYGKRPSSGMLAPRWKFSSNTGCSARIATVPTASPTGTARSSAGSPSRPTYRCGPSGTSARPVLVTANDYGLGLYNGDTGVTVLQDGALRAAMAAVPVPAMARSCRLEADRPSSHRAACPTSTPCTP